MVRSSLARYLVTLIAVVVSTGCRACSYDEIIATLGSKQGDVQHSDAPRADVFRAAAVGVTFTVGDAVKTGHSAQALLELEGGGKLRMRENTVIHFMQRPPKKHTQALDLKTGQVTLEAGSEGIQVLTDVGLARIEANSQLVMRREKEVTVFDVTVGKALLETSDGIHAIEAGQSYVVRVGNAVLEPQGSAEPTQPKTLNSGAASATPSEDIAASPINARVFGDSVSQMAPNSKTFVPLAPGETPIREGSKLRVGAGSHVELARGGSRVTLDGAGLYNVGPNASTFVEVSEGHLSVTGKLHIAVPGGTIETTANALATVDTANKNRTQIRVRRGTATLNGPSGLTQVNAGEEGTLDGNGSAKVQGRGLDYADVKVFAGETFTIHDPNPPTAVRFQFGTLCGAGATVRLGGRSGGAYASGESSVSLPFNVGRREYVVYCLDADSDKAAPAARGVVTVVKDAGTRPMPRKPPATSVSVDGRNYTVMYQNQLPSLNVGWPNAPAANQYTLTIESRGAKKRHSLSSPSFSFASGTLGEGTHSFYFEGAGKVSRHTNVEIAFDNAAPMAKLTTPVDVEASNGGELTLAGVAQPGWQVEVNDIKVTQDEQQRFSQQVHTPTTERALAVKLTNPTRGVHFYLRRLARQHE